MKNIYLSLLAVLLLGTASLSVYQVAKNIAVRDLSDQSAVASMFLPKPNTAKPAVVTPPTPVIVPVPLAGTLTGAVEALDATHVSGWACVVTSNNSKATPSNISISIQTDSTTAPITKVLVYSTLATIPRPDITPSSSHPCTAVGFNIPFQSNATIMSKVGDGKAHSLYIYGNLTNLPLNSIKPAVLLTAKIITIQSAQPAPTPTPKPTLSSVTLTAKLVGTAGAQLTWPAVPAAKSYNVYLNGYFLTNTTALTYSDPDGVLLPGSTYTYTVMPQYDNSTPPDQIDISTCQTLALNPDTATPEIHQSFLASVWDAFYNLVTGKSLVAQVTQTTQTATCSGAKGVVVSNRKAVSRTGTLNILDILVDYPNSSSKSSAHDIVASIKGKLFGILPPPTKLAGGGLMYYVDNSAKRFYYNQSFQQLNITGTAVGPYKLPLPYLLVNNFASVVEMIPHPPFMYETINRMVLDDNKGMKLSDYNIIIYTWPYMNSDGSLGISDKVADTNAIVHGDIMINGIQDASTYTHEIGHELGLFHAGSISCPGTPSDYSNCGKVNNYGDPLDVMGNNAGLNLNPPHKYDLGWIPQQTINKSGTYKIIPVEYKTAIDYRILKNDTKETYYLESDDVLAFSKSADESATPTYSYPKKVNIGINKKFSNGLLGLLNFYNDPDTVLLNPLPGSGITRTAGITSGTAEIQYGSTFEDTINKFKVIAIGPNADGSDVYVRFDAKPIVTATVASATSVNLSWNWPTDQPIPTGGYEVFRNGTSTKIKTNLIKDPSPTSFTDTGLVAGAKYTYYVRGFDAFTELPRETYPMSFSDPVSVTTNSNTPPVPPLPPALPTVTLTASAMPYSSNSATLLTWTSANATACSASADQASPQWAGPLALSSAVGISVNPTVTTKYTITCTGSNLTTISDSKTVTVTPSSPTIIGYMHPGYWLGSLFDQDTTCNVTTAIYNTTGVVQKYNGPSGGMCALSSIELLPASAGYSIAVVSPDGLNHGYGAITTVGATNLNNYNDQGTGVTVTKTQ